MQLKHEFKNAWKKISSSEKEDVMSYCEEYKTFLNGGKTERECANAIVETAKEYGFKSFADLEGQRLNSGDRVIFENRGKGVAMFVIGENPIEDGMNIVAAHIDSPRLDIKPFPLYEDSEMAFLKTHYYGGIKKYQWTTVALSIHGVIVKTSGEKINVSIGEDDSDPVFYISDLLVHLSKDQMEKKAAEVISGEGLNIMVGSIPDMDEEKEAVKMNVLKFLNEKYGTVEEDFLSAELQVVPAGKARDVGFDRSMIASYGHDDRICSYAALEALVGIEKPKRTCAAIFADKEEIGSVGNTGMESRFFENSVAELINMQCEYSGLKLKRALSKSKVLSADVTAAFDANFPEVMDKKNSAFIGKGIVITKYTGVKGKAGTSDANAEFIAEIRKILNENDVVWQSGELGKVDQGGGGTIAYILANYGAEVLDCGVALIGMHAPLELASKVDAYMAKKGYSAFFKNA